MGQGGWMGPERSLGGMSRTFGLQNRSGAGSGAPSGPIKRALLRRVLRQFAPYWPQWTMIFACIGVNAGLGILPPLAVRGILDHAIPGRDVRLLALLVGGIVALSIVSGLIGVLQNYLNARVGEGIVFDLRNALYRHLQRMSLPFYTTTRAGEIVSRINNDVTAVQSVATSAVISIVNNLVTILVTAGVIFALNWRLALLSIVIVPCLYLPTRLVGRFRNRLSRETQESQADLLAFLQERLNIGGMLLTKMFGQAANDSDQFTEYNRKVRDLNVRQALAGRWLFMCLSVFSVTGPALIYAFGGYQAIQHELTVGTVIAFVAYLTNLYRPMSNLANVYVDVLGGLAVFERIFQFLDLEPEVTDRPDAIALATTQAAIRFESVGFSYPMTGEAGSFALENVSFEIEPGQRVALVGPSGAGKTTITYLLPRLLDPAQGRILLDGRDLRDLTLDSLRAHIGMVTQETFLFHTTVRENLLYARPGATEAEMIAAAQCANIHEMIASLPKGYDTVVGERAFRLSGGERQRLSIARAILKDPRFLILDEATSSLDATSEFLIQEALETLLHGRTSLIIAHRLSTILTADKILVLDHGRLVESGRHDELLARDGLYAELYRKQFNREPDEAGAHFEE